MFRFGDPGGRMYTSAGTGGANILAHWTTIVGVAGSWSVQASAGRTTGSCLRLSSGSQSFLNKTFDNQQTWGVAFAYRFSHANDSTAAFLTLVDSSSNQLDLRLNTNGTIAVTRNGTVLATSTSAMSVNTWNHIEFKGKIDPSAGTIEVRVNGAPWIGPLTGQNTRATANSYANGVWVGTSGGSTAYTWDFDDIIIWDSQTTDANGFADIHDFIGDCGLVWLLPTGAGTTTQWTPDTGSNYARVNEATPDGDTSYVDDGTVGHIDTYAMADLAGTVTAVKSIASIHYAKKTDVGSRGMKAELRSASANAAHATEIALGNSYQYYFSNWGQDPNNGSPTNWTPTSVNALEAGQNVSS